MRVIKTDASFSSVEYQLLTSIALHTQKILFFSTLTNINRNIYITYIRSDTIANPDIFSLLSSIAFKLLCSTTLWIIISIDVYVNNERSVCNAINKRKKTENITVKPGPVDIYTTMYIIVSF